MRRYIALGAIALLTACAKSPDSIGPSYVSEIGYHSWTCRQLSEENARLQSALAVASARQENARTNDVVGVVLVGLPVSTLSGDNIAPEIGRLKGEMDATFKAYRSKQCSA
jgi:hypothetical protein